jgi:hypothetical protein
MLAQENYVKEINKIILHEQSKVNKLSGDGMKLYSKTWTNTQEIITKIVNKYK